MKNGTIWLYIICAAITIFGIVTGKFLFLLFVIPLGGLFRKKNNDQNE
ncbi:hypothetical protein [Altibacter sp. HG106]|nr:hypothetical protein [Altibacter sp. HG106]MDC7995349.1 hypothetical protein [Altibacter sp. HG106]